MQTKITSGNERKLPVSGCRADISSLLDSSAEDFERKTVNKIFFSLCRSFLLFSFLPFHAKSSRVSFTKLN